MTLLGYILGMLLLGALPSKWDHVAAIYLQGKTAHTAIDYTLQNMTGLAQSEGSNNMHTKLAL